MVPFDVRHLSRWGTDCFHQITYPSNKSANIFSDSSWLLSSSHLWPPGKTMKRNKYPNVFRWMTFHAFLLSSKEADWDACSWTCFGDCNLFSLLRPFFIFLIYQPGSSGNFLGCSLLQNQALNSGEKSVEASGLHPAHLTYSLDGHWMAPKNLPLAHMICAVVHVNKGGISGSLMKAIGVFQHVPLWIVVLSCGHFVSCRQENIQLKEKIL